jgi:D-alanyl-D-alanine carboxypeptidase
MRPHRVFIAIALIVASTAPAQAPRIQESELIGRLTRTMDSLSKADAFSGVVVITRGGQPVFQQAYGMADRESKRPNTVATVFNIGSINKMFTATAIRQLAAAGKIHLDSTVGFHWPDYPNRDVANKVTVRQLIDMRSGVTGNIFAAPPGRTRHDVRHNREYHQLFVNTPLAFEPGSNRAYSNAGYILLGLLVERASGEDYYDYVRKHVYEPAGMTHTAHHAVDELPPDAAIGYTRGGPGAATGPLRSNRETLPGRGSAAGGGYTTAADLVRFMAALRAGKITGGPRSGLGVAGGAPGINAILEGELPGGYDLIVLANMDPPAAERVGQLVRGWLGAPD